MSIYTCGLHSIKLLLAQHSTAQRNCCSDASTLQALYHFAQAGRKVILRNRATHRLALISALVQKLKSPDAAAATSSSQADGPRHAAA